MTIQLFPWHVTHFVQKFLQSLLFKNPNIFALGLSWVVIRVVFLWADIKRPRVNPFSVVTNFRGQDLTFLDVRALNWPRPIVRHDQQSAKDEFSFNELVLMDKCPCLTIIRKDKLSDWTSGNLVQFRALDVKNLSPHCKSKTFILAVDP